MSKQKILVIEDEHDIAEMIAMRLQKEMFVVKTADNGTTGWKAIAEYHPDLLILDLMLPGMSGLEILKRLRSNCRMKHLPVLILSAKGEESDIVVGLELGADDYLTKPFSMSILVARINVILRRASGRNESESERFTIGRLCIDVDKHQVFVGEEPIPLTLTEFRLLASLASARGRVLTRDQLIDKAIGSDAIVTDRTIDVHLNSLRGKLGEVRSLIETVRGIGYRMGEEAQSAKRKAQK